MRLIWTSGKLRVQGVTQLVVLLLTATLCSAVEGAHWMASPASVHLKQSSLDSPDVFQGRLFLTGCDGRAKGSSGRLGMQLEIASQGQHSQGSEQRVKLGAGKGQLS